MGQSCRFGNASGSIVGRKRPAPVPPKAKTNDKLAASKVIKRLDDNVAGPRCKDDTTMRVRTENVAIAKVLVRRFPMLTEEDVCTT